MSALLPAQNRRKRSVRGVLATATIVSGIALAPGTALGKGCGDVSAEYSSGEGGAGARITLVRGISCKEAKRVFRQCVNRKTIKGWSAGADASRTPTREILYRGSKRIEWVGTAGGGATCTAASVEEANSESA